MNDPSPTAVRRRLVLPIVVAALAVALLAGCEKRVPYIATLKPGELSVCLFPNFQPFAGKDAGNVWSGWDYTYLGDFAKALNLKLVVVEIPKFDGIWTQPGDDRCDIAGSGISDLPARRKETEGKGVWSATYYTVLRAYAVRKGTALTGLAEMNGQEVIVTGQSTADLDLVNRIACAKDPSLNITIRRQDNETESAQEVTDGKAFAYGGGYGSIQTLAKPAEANLDAAWPHCFMTAECTEQGEPFSFVVRAKSEGLVSKLDAYIDAGQGGGYDYPGNVEKRAQGGDPVPCPMPK